MATSAIPTPVGLLMSYDGKLQLLTSGCERALGYPRAERRAARR